MYGPVPPAALFHAPELETSLSKRLLLGGEALRVGLPDVAEGDLGVGEAAGQVFLDLEDAAFEAQWCGEAGVDDLHAVADVRAFRVVRPACPRAVTSAV